MTATDQTPVRVFEDGTEEVRLSIHETLVTPTSDEVLKHHLAQPDTTQLVERDVQLQTVHGPHPELTMSAEKFTDFACGALT